MAKAISENRDQLQSRLLVWIVGTVLILAALPILILALHPHNSGFPALKSVGISLTFGMIVWALRSATAPAAFLGALICMELAFGTAHPSQSIGRSALTPLATLFVLTFLGTRLGRRIKERSGLAEPRRGRQASQVIANLSPAVILIVACFLNDLIPAFHHNGLISFADYAMPTLVLATLASATADTVSSELGQAFGGTPILLTTLSRVPPGTDGAITLLGTTAGILAATLVAITGLLSLNLTLKQAGVTLAAATFGLFLDSLLGATVERKGWLGNDLVNFTSTLAAGIFAALLLAL